MNLALVASQVGLWPLLGAVLPLVVAVATKRETRSGVQGVAFAALASLLGVAQAGVLALQAGQAFDWKVAVSSAVASWVVGQTAHANLWRSTGLAHWLQGFGSAVVAVEHAVPVSVEQKVGALLEAALVQIENAHASSVAKHAVPVVVPAAPVVAAPVVAPDDSTPDLSSIDPVQALPAV